MGVQGESVNVIGWRLRAHSHVWIDAVRRCLL